MRKYEQIPSRLLFRHLPGDGAAGSRPEELAAQLRPAGFAAACSQACPDTGTNSQFCYVLNVNFAAAKVISLVSSHAFGPGGV